MAILIVTHRNDNDAPLRVMDAVRARGERAYRLDTDRFPTEVCISLTETAGQSHDRGAISGPEGRLDLSEVTAIWYRRNATGAGIPNDLEPELRSPSIEESRRVVYGMLAMLDVFCLDRLDVLRQAEHKPLQLRLARELGLTVPRTLITNDPAAVHAFAQDCPQGLITKMMASFAVYTQAGEEQVVFTNPVSEDDLTDLDGLDLCPMTFQEAIDKALELRVTVVGQQVMAAAIDSQKLPRARDDWRREGLALVDAWTHYRLPKDVEQKTLALMDALGLNYGALDFIVTPAGEHVFLEVNPAGEFMWLMRHPGLPIDEALADVLTGRAPRRLAPKQPPVPK